MTQKRKKPGKESNGPLQEPWTRIPNSEPQSPSSGLIQETQETRRQCAQSRKKTNPDNPKQKQTP